MAALNSQAATSGLVGALTSLFVGVSNNVIPDGNLKSLVSIIAGMTASYVAFELIAWLTFLRLSQQRAAIERLIPTLEKLQDSVSGSVERQLALMQDKNAPQKQLKEIEKAISDGAFDITRVLLEAQKRSTELFRELSSR